MELSNQSSWIKLSSQSCLNTQNINSSSIRRVRGIILYNDSIILIKRERSEEGKKILYYVFPGGGVEEDDKTLEAALHREIFEELGIKISISKNLYLNSYNNQNNGYFLCEYLSGQIGTGTGPEFNDKNYSDRGTYTPVIVPISKIADINLVPEVVKNRLILDLENGTI